MNTTRYEKPCLVPLSRNGPRPWSLALLHILALSLIFCQLGVFEAAAAEADTNATATSSSPPFSVTLSLASATPIAYFDPIYVTVEIVANRAVDLKSVDIEAVGELAAIYEGHFERDTRAAQDPTAPPNAVSGDASGMDPISPRGVHPRCPNVQALDSGQKAVIICQIPSPGRWTDHVRDSLLLTKPATRRVLVTVTERLETEGRTAFVARLPLDIAFVAPRLAIFYGGLAGAFLLALFSLIRAQVGQESSPSRWVRDFAASPPNMPRISPGALISVPVAAIWRVALLTMLGGICALILILLVQTTEGSAPPISIRVQDFWGGVVIGLFSLPLSRWLAEQLSKLK